MRKFVSNGNQNSNAKAPVSRRKKRSDSSSENSQQSSGVSRSSSEPALNQPQEAFVREAPSITSLNKKGMILLAQTLNSSRNTDFEIRTYSGVPNKRAARLFICGKNFHPSRPYQEVNNST